MKETVSLPFGGAPHPPKYGKRGTDLHLYLAPSYPPDETRSV